MCQTSRNLSAFEFDAFVLLSNVIFVLLLNSMLLKLYAFELECSADDSVALNVLLFNVQLLFLLCLSFLLVPLNCLLLIRSACAFELSV